MNDADFLMSLRAKRARGNQVSQKEVEELMSAYDRATVAAIKAQMVLEQIDALYAMDHVDEHGRPCLANDETYRPDWWLGTCDSVVSAAVEASIVTEEQVVMWGGYTRKIEWFAYADGEIEIADDVAYGHCWIEIGPYIVDPTRWQFGDGLPRIVLIGGDAFGTYNRHHEQEEMVA